MLRNFRLEKEVDHRIPFQSLSTIPFLPYTTVTEFLLFTVHGSFDPRVRTFSVFVLGRLLSFPKHGKLKSERLETRLLRRLSVVRA